MKYRTEVDGLRAIAILPVIWLHSGLPYLSGGFLGVDVFFVISGFLITNILLKDFESNTFSLVKFYERRARRILPALFFVILVTSVVIPLVSSQPKFLDDYGLSVLSTIFFSSNIYFWQTSGYFGSASELSPMLHTWSLAVEEQFYILFPLLIMLLFSRGRNLIVLAISLVAVASLMIAEWGALNSPNGNFYLLPSRAWELMAGALAAIFYSGSVIAKVRESFSDWLAVIGVVLILSAYYFFSSTTSHPSSLTIWPVLGAVLILLFCSSKSFLGQVLSSRPLRFVGLISYSLYLWHQPVLALMKKSYSIHLEPLQIVGSIILIFALSYVTWRFIENPFRDKQRYTPIRIYRFSFSGILVVALVGWMLTLNTDFQRVISPEKMSRYDQMLAAHESHSQQKMFDEDCKFWSGEFSQKFLSRFNKCSQQHNKAIFILGGSHGMDLYNAIATNTDNPFVVSVSKHSCRAHSFVGEAKSPINCQYEDFKEFLLANSKSISHVLYTQTPDRLFMKGPFNKASVDDLSVYHVDEVVKYLGGIKEDYSISVIMIGMLPPLAKAPIYWDHNYPIEGQLDSMISVETIYLTGQVDSIFESKLKIYNIPYISKIVGFKLNLPDDLIIDGEITYSDNRHISDKGEEVFGRRLLSVLQEMGFAEFK